MTDEVAAAEATGGELSDSEYLQQLGVQPRFRRALGFLTGSLFAVAFQGPTTGALLITGATLAFGGPAFIWAIPIIFVLQLLLAITWAELSSHYPLTGGIYQWARRLGGAFIGWMTGLFYVVAIILVMPAVGYTMNIVLSGLFSSITMTLTHEVIISIIVTVIAAVLMATSVRVVATLNSVGVALEIAVLLIAAVGLLFHQHQPISVLGNTAGVQGHGSYFWPFLVVIALVVTQLVGFETAGAFAEETRTARIKPSQAIIAGLAGTAIVLFIFDFALLLAIPNVGKAMADPAMIPDVLTAALGSGFAKLFFVGALISVLSTAVATLATIVRMIYGMARNDQLPVFPVPHPAIAAVRGTAGHDHCRRRLVDAPAAVHHANPRDRGCDYGADHHPVHARPRVAAGTQAAGLAALTIEVPARPLGAAGDRCGADLDGGHLVGCGVAASGYQPDARPAARDRGPGDRGHRGRRCLVVRQPAQDLSPGV